MFRLETKVKIPFLWGKTSFKKNFWSQVNLIVGPNGSGKTLLAEDLARQFKEAGYPVTFLRSDRTEQENLFSILKDNNYIREKIEKVLSAMFGKSIQFEKQADGSFIPMVTNKARNVEYNLKEGECHGLKEIITLLVALYSSKSGCLIFDEPELHLHPQFQLFFMNEIRKVVNKNPKRIFFLITHSPFFIDLRFPEDLIGVIVCRINRIPTHIDSLSKDDEMLFRRFLPRFNTYHKQFFFSDNQIFVEGYTDQQIFSNLLSLIETSYNTAGTGIIDVGGKDELGVFFKVCSLLGTEGRIISDLDALFQGKLRDVVCADSRPALWLEKQHEKQFPFYRSLFSLSVAKRGPTLTELVNRLDQFLIDIGNAICDVSVDVPENLDLFFSKVKNLYQKYENVEYLDTFKAVVLQGILKLSDSLGNYLPLPLASKLPLVKNLVALIFAAVEAARVYILPRGCIEHYYTRNKVQYMPISGKDKLFHVEREYMNSASISKVKKEYAELIYILEKSCSGKNI